MDLQAEKLLLIEQLARLQDAAIIRKVKEVLQSSHQEKAVGYNADESIITQADLISRAAASNKAIEEGRTKSIDRVRENVKGW
ncbi:hypothetical protein [uncultured Imperialibacter sp.]|mgnify:CR=1 FL=1|uniref:hypothetical protein n=1 Tax=uncultured Imperialibacter sp. TaxID=1672639 RepID=UPI0030DDA153|tara:strand:+ start:2769 stop:3017 length:249 start_codon:yes stop_codon:yes gene_type:complete